MRCARGSAPSPTSTRCARRGSGSRSTLSPLMESSRFERTVRTESNEIFAIYGGARRVGGIDLDYGRFEVHGTLLLEVDVTEGELQQLIDQIDEELVQTGDRESGGVRVPV